MKYIAIKFFTLWFGLLIFLNPDFALSGKDELSTVQNLSIPRFNEDGHLSWELHASEVKTMNKETFLATNPLLYLFTNQILELTAKSETGEFLLKSERAHGSGLFDVTGNGFSAMGNDWQWNNSVKGGRNQMIFKRDGKVTFSKGLEGFFVVPSNQLVFQLKKRVIKLPEKSSTFPQLLKRITLSFYRLSIIRIFFYWMAM